MSPPASGDALDPTDVPDDAPDWVGYWRVRRYDGEQPSVPTYYDATPESWDVIKDEPTGLHVARHPILEIQGDTIVLKDEGADVATAERWQARVSEGTLRVTSLMGPHAGAVGVAERIDTDPRDRIGEAADD